MIYEIVLLLGTLIGHIRECFTHATDQSDFTLYRCSSQTISVGSQYFEFQEKPGSSVASVNFCLVKYTAADFTNEQQYNLSVDLWNENSAKPETFRYGHPGLALNIQDENNLDVIYLRIHSESSPSSCYQTGRVIDGLWSSGSSGDCPSGPPAGRTWFNMKAIVESGTATIYLNEESLVSYNLHFQNGGNIGVLLANGYENVVRMKDFFDGLSPSTTLEDTTVIQQTTTSIISTSDGPLTSLIASTFHTEPPVETSSYERLGKSDPQRLMSETTEKTLVRLTSRKTYMNTERHTARDQTYSSTFSSSFSLLSDESSSGIIGHSVYNSTHWQAPNMSTSYKEYISSHSVSWQSIQAMTNLPSLLSDLPQTDQATFPLPIWTKWSSCSSPCNYGKQFKVKFCHPSSNVCGNRLSHSSNKEIGYEIRWKTCNSSPCPLDGIWILWQTWGSCSASCGSGTRTRIRRCFGPANGGKPCTGVSTQTTICQDTLSNGCNGDSKSNKNNAKDYSSITGGHGFTPSDSITSHLATGTLGIIILVSLGVTTLIMDLITITRPAKRSLKCKRSNKK